MTTGAASEQRSTIEGAGGPAGAPVVPDTPSAQISHNLNGQRLGRKGRSTRERILSAVDALLAAPEDSPLSLSAVAREASLGMTSLYNYFADLTELLLAVLDPVAAGAETDYRHLLRKRWSDDELHDRCLEFVRAYHAYWSRHSRLLHLRNTMADSGDDRMMVQRIESAVPQIALIVRQMDGNPAQSDSLPVMMATVLVTGLERMITVATDRHLSELFGATDRRPVSYYLAPSARLMELAIRDARAAEAGD